MSVKKNDVLLKIDYRIVCLPLSASARILLFVLLTDLIAEFEDVTEVQELIASSDDEIERSFAELEALDIVVDDDIDTDKLNLLLPLCSEHYNFVRDDLKENSLFLPLSVIRAGVSKDLMFAAAFLCASKEVCLSATNHASLANCLVSAAKEAQKIAYMSELFEFGGQLSNRETIEIINTKKIDDFWALVTSTAKADATDAFAITPRIHYAFDAIDLPDSQQTTMH